MSASKREWAGKFLGIIRATSVPVWTGNVLTGADHKVSVPVTITRSGLRSNPHQGRRVWVDLHPEEALKVAEEIRVAALDAIRARDEL